MDAFLEKLRQRVRIVDDPRMVEPQRIAKNRREKGKKRTPEVCPVCGDAGVVELKGVVEAHGSVYSRGSAPCRWCETGIALAAKLENLPGQERVDRPAAYSWDEVIVHGDDVAWQLDLTDERLERREERRAAHKHAASKDRASAQDVAKEAARWQGDEQADA